jgi:polynucleotide 5'-kinase involved in rRNA processing
MIDNFLRFSPQTRCYFYGDISPKGDPRAYLRTIVNLYDFFRNEYYDAQPSNELEPSKRAEIPLVVNTHGWVKGKFFCVRLI